MCNHIANQCDAVVKLNPTGRLDIIMKLSEFDLQSQSPKPTKRMLQVRLIVFHPLKIPEIP
jgi:hypothetical protein